MYCLKEKKMKDAEEKSATVLLSYTDLLALPQNSPGLRQAGCVIDNDYQKTLLWVITGGYL
jgi:hypothetical protein